MLSEKERIEYLMHRWAHCPKCDGEDVQGGPIEIDGETAWQKVTCLACDFVWVDSYCLCDVQTAPDGEEQMEPDMATARELREALSDLLCIFDVLAVDGNDGFESDPKVIAARATLAKGLRSPDEEAR